MSMRKLGTALIDPSLVVLMVPMQGSKVINIWLRDREGPIPVTDPNPVETVAAFYKPAGIEFVPDEQS